MTAEPFLHLTVARLPRSLRRHEKPAAVTVLPALTGLCQALVAITAPRPQGSAKVFVRPDRSQGGGEQVIQLGSGTAGISTPGGDEAGGGWGATAAGAGLRLPTASIRTVPAIPVSSDAAAEAEIQQESGSGTVGRIVAENGGATITSGLSKPTDSEPRRQLT